MRSQPLRCRFRTATGHTRDIVRGITHQCQVVNDLAGLYTKFFNNGGGVHDRIRHGVDEGDLIVDKLRHVLVTSRHHGFKTRFGCLHTKRTNNIVRFDPIHDQQREAHFFHDLIQRFYLRTHVIGHSLSIRFVLGVDIVAKGFSAGIKNNHHYIGVVVANEPSEHVDYTIDCPGRLAFCIGQGRHSVKGPIEISRAVHQNHWALRIDIGVAGHV